MDSSGVRPRPQQLTQDCSEAGGGERPAAKHKQHLYFFHINMFYDLWLYIVTHVPGAHKHRDDVKLRLFWVSRLHELQQATKGFSFL